MSFGPNAAHQLTNQLHVLLYWLINEKNEDKLIEEIKSLAGYLSSPGQMKLNQGSRNGIWWNQMKWSGTAEMGLRPITHFIQKSKPAPISSLFFVVDGAMAGQHNKDEMNGLAALRLVGRLFVFSSPPQH